MIEQLIIGVLIGSGLMIGFSAGLTFGFKLNRWLTNRLVDNWRKAARAWRDAADEWKRTAELEKKRANTIEQWADATFQNIADAAADYGLQLQLNDKPIEPRADAKEWPSIVGENK